MDNIILFVLLVIIPIVLSDFLILYFIISSKKHVGIIALILLIIIEIKCINVIFFPTYWKYPDRLIDSDVVRIEHVESVYGAFDKEGQCPDYKAYYIYTDKEGNDHYYCISYDTDGFVSIITDEILE